jgi:hypothetical protein
MEAEKLLEPAKVMEAVEARKVGGTQPTYWHELKSRAAI